MTAKIIPFTKKMTPRRRNELLQEALDNLSQVQLILTELEKKHEARMKEQANEQKD